MRILVIEDSVAYRNLVIEVSASIGLQPEGAGSGEEGLGKLQQACYDLICVDLHLPGMDGLELCRQVRKLEDGHQPSVILLTSDQDEFLQQKAFDAGITEILRKTEARSLKESLENFVRRIKRKIDGRVLYIEDSLAVAGLTKSFLSEAGLEVQHFTSADTALKVFREQDFDLVISDIVVEGTLSGIGLLRAIRALPDIRKEVPFLAVSGTLGEQSKVTLLRQGADDFIAKPVLKDEMLARITNLIAKKQLLDQVLQQQEQLKRLAITDELTGLYNKAYLNGAGKQMLSDSLRHRYPLSVLVIDLDHFKKINDSYGHDTGDRVLAATGKLLRETCREGDVAARFGGEEFVLLLLHCSLSNARRKAEQLRSAIEQLHPEGLNLTSSVGVSCTQKDQHIDFVGLFKQADQAVYEAKNSGRNRVVSYSPLLSNSA